MPDPSAAHPAAQAAASAATDAATIGAWAALIAAAGLAWRRVFGPRPKAAPAPAAHHGPTVDQVMRLYEQVSQELIELRDLLRAVASKEDLQHLSERMDAGVSRLEEAGERRVQALHARMDEHLQHHARGGAL